MNKEMKLSWISKYTIIIIVILCLISRIPQLLSDNLILDGDECIVGLMSKHFLESKELPLYFYGQSYGFSFIEVFFIRIFYMFLGVTEMAVKLAMLSLWTIGIIFFFKSLKAIEFKNNSWIPYLITAVFIFSPSFAVWSMKARGGYLTAFVLSSIVIYLIFHKKWRSKLWIGAIIGFISVVIYQSQVLWLAGLFPIIGYNLYQNRLSKYGLSMLVGLLSGLILFYFIKLGLPTFWSPKIIGIPSFNLETFTSIFDRMYVHLTGFYFYGDAKSPHLIIRLMAILTMVIIFTSLLFSLIYIIKKKKITPLMYITSLSVLFTIGYLIFFQNKDYRYLLPLTGFALILIAIALEQIKKQKIIILFLLVWISMGAFSLYEFKNYSFENKQALTSLVDKLETQKISHIFCEGGLLQWQIMFYSNEKVIARYKSKVDRYPKYIYSVDRTFSDHPEKVALVGYYNEDLVNSSPHFTAIANTYFIYSPVDLIYMKERGFEINDQTVSK